MNSIYRGSGRSAAVALSLAIFVLYASAGAPPANSRTELHPIMPLGYEVLTLKPAGASLSLLGRIEVPDLQGAWHVGEGTSARIVAADGTTVTHFPKTFSFRVTVSLRKTLVIEPASEVTSAESPQDFLLKLKFRFRVFRGLESREIQPELLQMIGVPADVAYDERVYRISFSGQKIPVSDRCILEVLSPTGERLTRLHFDLL